MARPAVGPAHRERAPGITLTLAAYQAWFGSGSHIQPPPYISTDTAVISGHIAAALAQGIDGFVVDWYGPPDGVPNDRDRWFIDEATRELLRQSEGRDFYVALMYDEGTVSAAETLVTAYETRAISDLLYARQYFTMPAYLHVSGDPDLFVFPYPSVDPHIRWEEVRSQLGVSVTLYDKDPDPGDTEHDDSFDGFFAWVQPAASQWLTDGTEWGEAYLAWFYDTMVSASYSDRIAVGGVWPGFDDSLAPWGRERYMWRRCGQTWRDTWRIATQHAPPIVMIDTWNDFEEGTDIEHGIGECLAPSRQRAACPGQRVVYAHTVSNTGKFTDTFYMPIATAPTSATLAGHASGTLTVAHTVPQTAQRGARERLIITATSELSAAVHSRVTDTTTVWCCLYLPLVLRDAAL